MRQTAQLPSLLMASPNSKQPQLFKIEKPLAQGLILLPFGMPLEARSGAFIERHGLQSRFPTICMGFLTLVCL
jgi:hypothetical protein